MARPIKNNADYFSHDADMRNNRKVKALRAKFGLEGYAIWCMFLEALTDASGFQLEWDELGRELISGDFQVPLERLIEIVDYMAKLQLIEVAEYITCPALLHRMQFVLEERERKRQWKESKKPVKDGENEVKDGENAQRKVKESKVKESKVKEIKGKERENTPSPVEISNEKDGGFAASEFDAAKAAIVEWARPDDWAALRKVADSANYDPSIYGSVKTEVDKFCAHYYGRAPDFVSNPVGFFEKKFIKWLIDAKSLNKRPNAREYTGRRTGPTNLSQLKSFA